MPSNHVQDMATTPCGLPPLGDVAALLNQLPAQPPCPQLRAVLEYHLSHDPQTGLPNLDFLVQRIDASLQAGIPCSLLFLEIGGIDEIGEYHGLAAALFALRSMAERIRNTIGHDDVVARIHGGIYLALVFDAEPQRLAIRLKNCITRPLPWQVDMLHLTTAIGIVRSGDCPGAAEGLIRAGYAAAQSSLQHGTGICHFTAAQARQIERRYQLGARLHTALEQGGLSLYFQAEVRAGDGRLQAAEALLRWHDPVLGEVSPAEFIPIAEHNGLIAGLSTWVIHHALAELKKWQHAGLDIKMAINLSACDLHDITLLGRIQAALHASGVDPTRLVIELTESAVMRNPLFAARQLAALRALGVAISLDDFGTGFSSFSLLRQLPLDTLKIDRSFITDIAGDDCAAAIVRTIISLARTLRLKTVAEGVETAAQASLLTASRVDLLQGYFFGKPLAAADFLRHAVAVCGNEPT